MSETDADHPVPGAGKTGETKANQPAPIVDETDDAETDQPAPIAHEASEISYDEQRYPARPRRLRPKGRHLQNHDEMTSELVHYETLHARDVFTFRSQHLTGHELAVTIRQDLLDHLTGDAAPYNAPFTQIGIASTTATIIAASLGFTSITKLTRPSRWNRSNRRTCCWPCSMPCSRVCLPYLVGICAAC
jgi:hypothetical protein